MGTPDFAVATLKTLVENKYNIVGVITAPDKPAGRGRRLNKSAVKQYAESVDLNVLQPKMFELGLLDRRLSIDDYKDTLPHPIFKAAYDSVSALQENILETEQGLNRIFKSLRNACNEILPEHKFVDMHVT